jgi:ABC-type transport system substrate-binding protein
MILRIFISLVSMTLFATSCNMTFEIGLEPIPGKASSSTVVVPTQADTPTPGATEVPPTNTVTPLALFTSSPTPAPAVPSDTPSPTALPGLVVIPLSSLGTDIPWLPIDRSRWPTIHTVTFNTQLPPFDNPIVRQAFAASIDRDVIVEMAKSYHTVDPSPATTFIPPQTLGRDLYGKVGINFNPVKARELLTQAGYEDASSFPTVTFIVNSYGDIAPGARFNMANAMADMWHTYLGVTVEVQAYEFTPFRDRVRSNPPQLFWIAWLPDPGNDPDFIRLTYHTDAEYNYGHFSSSAFDSLVDRAVTIHDPAIRQALYVEAEEVLCETEIGTLPLYHTFTNIP